MIGYKGYEQGPPCETVGLVIRSCRFGIYTPTGVVGWPSPTHTQPYWVLLGCGARRYSSRSCDSLSVLIAFHAFFGSTPNSLAAFRPRIWSLISSVSSGYLCVFISSGPIF